MLIVVGGNYPESAAQLAVFRPIFEFLFVICIHSSRFMENIFAKNSLINQAL
jgi:hypothetical protein